MKILFKLSQNNQQRQHEKQTWIFPIKLAMYATYLKQKGNYVVWDGQDEKGFNKIITNESQIDVDFLDLPPADRIFTDSFNHKWQNNGNFKYHPGTYIQAADGCWWGRCLFCVERGRKYQIRPVNAVIEEIEECKSLGFREIFDDSGSFPFGNWLNEFCKKKRKIDIPMGCNMRMIDLDWKMLKDAGFRMILFGLESANDDTLIKINKGLLSEHHKHIIDAAKAGLDCHIAYMVSYPWETLKEEMNTIKLVRWLLRKGYAKTAQCSVFTTPDGRYFPEKAYLTKKLYNVAFMPDFWYNKIRTIKDIDDWKYFIRSIKEGIRSKWIKQK